MFKNNFQTCDGAFVSADDLKRLGGGDVPRADRRVRRGGEDEFLRWVEDGVRHAFGMTLEERDHLKNGDAMKDFKRFVNCAGATIALIHKDAKFCILW